MIIDDDSLNGVLFSYKPYKVILSFFYFFILFISMIQYSLIFLERSALDYFERTKDRKK